MRFCISFGVFSLKYFIYCFLFASMEIYIMFFIYYFDEQKNGIFRKHYLLDSFCFYLGYLLNFIPTWIDSNINMINEIKELYPKSNKPYDKNLSKKDIIKFLGMCLMFLSLEFVEVILKKLNEENLQYEDDFLLFKFLVVFLLPRYFSEVYYKHQNISIIIFISVEIIKIIFFIIKDKEYEIKNFTTITILRVIYSSLSAFYYLYIKDLMKYKYISPYKCNFMLGIINFPLLIIIMFIISFTPFGKKENKVIFCDNIFELFEDVVKLNAIYIILLILLPFVYGMALLLVNKAIYDFTVYHIFIYLIVVTFIKDVLTELNDIYILAFLISCFIIQLIMILVFLEIVELNFCGLNENLKRNIEARGIIEAALINEDDAVDNDERKSINNEATK